VYPGLSSYSLGNLCRELNIELNDRHRAFGDARATVTVLKRNLERDAEMVTAMLKANSKESKLPPNLSKEIYLNLPEKAGVYYLLNRSGEVLYVGKAMNIRKRFDDHCTDGSKIRSIRLLWENIFNITYELCGNEMVALLFESNEIKRLWPPYNTSLKRPYFKYGLFKYTDQLGYIRFSIQRISKNAHTADKTFHTLSEARLYLGDLVKEYKLCPKLSGIQKAGQKCVDFVIGHCKGACERAEPAESYNDRVLNSLNLVNQPDHNFIVVGKGRNQDENAVVLVENGEYRGFGFVPQDVSPSTSEEVLSYVKFYKSYPETSSIIESFVQRQDNTYKVISF
jgi:DNA polymerase-3 subunit epsilon